MKHEGVEYLYPKEIALVDSFHKNVCLFFVAISTHMFSNTNIYICQVCAGCRYYIVICRGKGQIYCSVQKTGGSRVE